MDDRWYYLRNGQSAGPFNAEKFREFAASDIVDSRTMVWQETLPDWIPLGESQLAHVLDVPLNNEKNTQDIAGLNRLSLTVTILNYAAWIITVAAIAVVCVFLLLSRDAGKWNIPWAITALCTVSAAVLAWAGEFTCGMIRLYRVWKCIPPADAVMTPVKAVVGCLIPILNIYWYFPAVAEAAKILNAQLVRAGAKNELVNEDLCRRFAIFHALWWLIIPIPAAMICWCRIPAELAGGCIALKQNRMMQRLADTRKAASAKESE